MTNTMKFKLLIIKGEARFANISFKLFEGIVLNASLGYRLAGIANKELRQFMCVAAVNMLTYRVFIY